MDVQPGDTVGISKATILIKGENAYGYCKAERGVHRLVRISPFDSNARRHTSFCAVDVVAEVTDEIDIEIPEDDVRIDVYRSSGKGGQGVNTTDSAVRITHIPSGLVVVCQNERSQIKNKATAWTVLKARLYEKKQDEQRAEMDRFYGEKGEIGWGAQIRSYVLQPYQMVKDLRTGASTSDTQGVLDGDIDRFINAWLRAGCPRHRNKDIQIEECSGALAGLRSAFFSAALEQRKEPELDQRADHGGDYVRERGAGVKADQAQHEATKKRAGHADHEIADQAETALLQAQAGQPAGDRADDQKEAELFEVHDLG